VLLVYAIRGPIRTFLSERTARIRAALEAGANAKREAETLRAQLERDTADLPNVRARLIAEMRETAESERRLLLEKARATAERIRLDAKIAAEQEAEGARAALRKSTVEQAVAEAVRLVRDSINPQDQARAVEEFVQAAGAA
jgi:F0F1-type ATP synthase membrane subunit b/b'